MILAFLPQLLATKMPSPLCDLDEQALAARRASTVWEAGRVETFPGLLDESALLQGLQSIFLEFPVAPQVWQCTQQRLRACRLWRLQYFVAWQRLRGEPWETLGPVPITSRDRTTIYAGLTGQRYPSSSSRGLDHLLPPGLGPEEHMMASCQLLPLSIRARGQNRIYPLWWSLFWCGGSTLFSSPLSCVTS